MSVNKVAHQCACEEPELGAVDADSAAVYCGVCEGYLTDLEGVYLEPN